MVARACDELGFEPPSREAAIRRHLKTLCARLARGELSPFEAAAIIHHEVLTPLNHPADLDHWCHLQDARDPVTYEDLDEEEAERRLREAAAAALTPNPS